MATGRGILVVDDHNATAELISVMLRMEGYICFAAESEPQALKLYDQARPALVITDEYLGDTTGSDLLRVLRRKYGRIVGPALVITGLPGHVTVLSTDVVMEKPFELCKLVDVVRWILGEPPKAQEAR